MTLIVYEIKGSGVSQEIIPKKHTIVEAIRPHIYRHRWPSGKLKLQIFDADNNLVAESKSVDISTITLSSEPFFHGYVRFDINAYLAKDSRYIIKIVGTDGYVFSESAYCGVCNGYDLGKYPSTFQPKSDLNEPLDLEIWERTVK